MTVDNVVELFTEKGHWIALKGENTAHAFPVSLIENIISGKISVNEADPVLIKDILRDWLVQVLTEEDDGK